jgi:hypothetical protein
MAYCSKCGAKVAPDDGFCQQCGTKTKHQPESPAARKNEQAHSDKQAADSEHPGTSKLKSALTYVGSAVALLLLIIFSAVLIIDYRVFRDTIPVWTMVVLALAFASWLTYINIRMRRKISAYLLGFCASRAGASVLTSIHEYMVG